jgi:hypothetical protein
MPRTHHVPLLCLALGGLGCPAKVPTPENQGGGAEGLPPGVAITDPDDPRVVRDSGDLYATESAPRPPAPAPALGSGKPDTSNGVCKLFSPKLPEPQCCPFETGFDAEKIKQLCGHALYMGESLHQSCGYYFLPNFEGSIPTAIRGSRLTRESATEAAEKHDLRMARDYQLSKFESTPVPGVEGAMWSDHDGIHWAFLPGWSTARLISWTADACPIEVMPEVLKLIAEAKEPPPNAPRPGLVPEARQ